MTFKITIDNKIKIYYNRLKTKTKIVALAEPRRESELVRADRQVKREDHFRVAAQNFLMEKSRVSRLRRVTGARIDGYVY